MPGGGGGPKEEHLEHILRAADTEGLPKALRSQRFYDDCLDVLTADGLFVVNLHAGHPQHAVYVDRIGRSLREHVGDDEAWFDAWCAWVLGARR